MEPFDYSKAIERIKAPFPSGTVQKRGDNGRAYIPNQVYTDRVEAATGSRWSREIRDVDINIPHGYVKVVVRISIGEIFRDGIGFAEIDSDGNGRGKGVSNKIDQALAEAVREALDTWQIGWKDLAPYYQDQKDWGKNPALRHLLQSGPPSELQAVQPRAAVEHRCIFLNCGKQLTADEWAFLGEIPSLNKNKMKYCFEHIPKHLKKRAPEEVLQRYEKMFQSK